MSDANEAHPDAYAPQPGDIAACWGRDWKSRFISCVTYWPLSPPGLRCGPSHVAILAPHPGTGELIWYESTTLCKSPCLIRREPTSGVQAHEWPTRINDYTRNGGTVVIYRLARGEDLDVSEVANLQERLVEMIAAQVQYDMRGALTSATRLWKYVCHWFGRFAGSLFCSDKIAWLLMRLGRLPRGNPNLYTPGGLLRTVVRHGVYQRHYVFTRHGAAQCE